MTTAPQRKVAIHCHHPAFLEAYVRVVSSYLGPDGFIVVDDISDIIHDGVPGDVSLLLIDAKGMRQSAFDKRGRLANAIAHTPQVIAVNLASTKAHATPHNLTPRETYIPEEVLYEAIQDLAIRRPSTPFTHREKQRSPSREHHEPRYLDSEDLSHIEEVIRGKIHFDQQVLSEQFVQDDTSVDALPETKAEELPQAQDIERSVADLQAYFADYDTRHSSNSSNEADTGILVVGEKGVGKTTLVHYAAANVKDANERRVFMWINYHFVVASQIDDTHTIIEGICDAAGESPDSPESVRDLCRRLVDESDCGQIQNPPIVVQTIVERQFNDPGFALHCYLHFHEQAGFGREHPQRMSRTESEQLSVAAKEWLGNLRSSPIKLIAHCLLYILESEDVNFEEFTCDQIVLEVGRRSESNESLRTAINRFLRSTTIGDELGHDRWKLLLNPQETRFKVANRYRSWPEFVIDLVSALSKEFSLILFFDNIDQKYSHQAEVRIVRSLLGLAQRLSQSNRFATVVTVRNSTYASHEFYKLDIIESGRWRKLQVRPPDLQELVKRRIEAARRAGLGIGSDVWWFCDFVYGWVDVIKQGGGKAVFDVVANRHPFNVRGQLDLFFGAAKALYAAMAHSRPPKASMSEHIQRLTAERPEFCQRAMIRGGYGKYVEQEQDFVPNIFDNDCPSSKYNAVVRVVMLEWMVSRQAFAMRSALEAFQRAGVPIEEFQAAMQQFKRFNIVRDIVERGAERQQVTRWGAYFHKNIAFELQYVQAVWWDTAMPNEYLVLMGRPRELTWSELEIPIGVFFRWFAAEEGALGEAYLQLVRDAVPVGRSTRDQSVLLSNRLGHNLGHAYHKIEQKVADRRRKRRLASKALYKTRS